MIRQAITCDICASEKRQTNHWFVAYEQAGELRVSGWNSRNRQRPGAKHLCGQTCLHKLVDDFMAQSISVRPQQSAIEESAESTGLEIGAGRVDALKCGFPPGHPTKRTLLAGVEDPGDPGRRTLLAGAELNGALQSAEFASYIPGRVPPAPTDASLTCGAAEVELDSWARLITPPEPVLPKPILRPQPELVTMLSRPRPENYAPIPAQTPRYASRNWRAEAWERERERELRAIENRPDIAARRRSSA